MSEVKQSGFDLCGVRFLQSVDTPNGKGIVQGILKKDDGSMSVIVSHNPQSLPPEMVPEPGMWKLVYYEPGEVS